MESPIVRMMFLSVGLALALAVTYVGYNALSSNTPDVNAPTIETEHITSKNLCEAVGGDWTSTTRAGATNANAKCL